MASTDTPTLPADILAPGKIDRAVLAAATVAFLAVLGAYVALKLAGQDPSDLLRLFSILAGQAVMTGGVAVRINATERKFATRLASLEESAQATAQDTQTVVRRTNGELDKRVRTLAYEATTKALEDHLTAHNGGGGGKAHT